jgi:hypothetical protein
MRAVGTVILAVLASAGCVDGSSALSGAQGARDGGPTGPVVDGGVDAGDGDDGGPADSDPPACPPVTADTEADFDLIPALATEVRVLVDGVPVPDGQAHLGLSPVDDPDLLTVDLGLDPNGERFIAAGLWNVTWTQTDCGKPSLPCGVYAERRRVEGGRFELDVPAADVVVRIELPESVELSDRGNRLPVWLHRLSSVEGEADVRLRRPAMLSSNPGQVSFRVVPGRYAVELGGARGVAHAAGIIGSFEVESDRAVTLRSDFIPRPYTVAGTLSFEDPEIFEQIQSRLDVVVMDEEGTIRGRDSVNDRGEYMLRLFPGRYRLGTALVSEVGRSIERHLSDGPQVDLGERSQRIDFDVDVREVRIDVDRVGDTKLSARLLLRRGERSFARVPAEGASLLLSPGTYRASWSGFCPDDVLVCSVFTIDPELRIGGGERVVVDVDRRDAQVTVRGPPSVDDASGFVQLTALDSRRVVGGPAAADGRVAPLPVPPRRFEVFFAPETPAFRPTPWIQLGTIDTAVRSEFEVVVPAPVRFEGRLLVDGAPVSGSGDPSGGPFVDLLVSSPQGRAWVSGVPLEADGSYELRVPPGPLDLRYRPGPGCTGAACAPQRLPRCTP